MKIIHKEILLESVLVYEQTIDIADFERKVNYIFNSTKNGGIEPEAVLATYRSISRELNNIHLFEYKNREEMKSLFEFDSYVKKLGRVLTQKSAEKREEEICSLCNKIMKVQQKCKREKQRIEKKLENAV